MSSCTILLLWQYWCQDNIHNSYLMSSVVALLAWLTCTYSDWADECWNQQHESQDISMEEAKNKQHQCEHQVVIFTVASSTDDSCWWSCGLPNHNHILCQWCGACASVHVCVAIALATCIVHRTIILILHIRHVGVDSNNHRLYTFIGMIWW